ncbi:hypothetical protein [Brevibacillus porteri]|uniref:hypothetical protein n=1 Tax=Brevibacillus porteri TaxID=2126350 RepID=UPI003D1AD505
MKSRLPAVITGLILIFVLIGFGTAQDFIPVLQKASSAPESAQSLTPLNNSLQLQQERT